MTVTIIFQNSEHDKHTGQQFEVASYEVHNAYNFLELKLKDGSTMQFNLDCIFSFSASAPPTESLKKK